MSVQFVSGNGGYITFQPTGGATTRLNIGKWTLRMTSKVVENTHSGVTSSNFEAVVPHNEWTLEVPLDIDNYPDDDVGLEAGQKGNIVFEIGASTETYELSNTIVESLEAIDDNSEDIVRVSVSGKGGQLT